VGGAQKVFVVAW